LQYLQLFQSFRDIARLVRRDFLAHDSMMSALYAIARPSVRLSVTRVDQSKTV